VFRQARKAATVAETAAVLDLTEDDAAEPYRRLAASQVIVLEPGTVDVWMANPLSARPTGFRVSTSDGRSYFGTCVWDGPGVLAMLGVDGTVATVCHDCDGPLTMEVRDGALQPMEAVGHFAVPAVRWWEDIGHT
jgi:hypothetical protein